MKVYLISDVPSAAEEIVEVLDRSDVNVISKDVQMDIKNIVNTFRSIALSGNSDMMLFVTDDPMLATIELNKVQEIRAANAFSESDVKAARNRDANVIIVKHDSAKKAAIAQEVVKAGSKITKAMDMVRNVKKPSNPIIPQPEIPEQKQSKPVQKQQQKKKGLLSDLKDALGIVDEPE